MRRLGDPWFNRMGMRGPVPWGNAPGGYGGKSYSDKVLDYSPIAYWPLWETSGTVAQCLINSSQNGSYTSDVSSWPVQSGIGDGNTAPYFDGINDWVNVFTPALAAVANPKEITIMIWVKPVTWADIIRHEAFSFHNTDARFLFMYKVDGTANYFRARRRWDANNDLQDDAAAAGLNYICYVLRVSESANQVSLYKNGIRVDGFDATAVVWVPPILRAAIGYSITFSANKWNGNIAHVALFNVLSEAAIADISTL